MQIRNSTIRLAVLLFGSIICVCPSLWSQDTLRIDSFSRVQISARMFGDSIIVRWAPADPGTWYRGNQYGYRLERYSRPPGTEYNPDGFELIADKIMKKDSAAFTQAVDQFPENKYLAGIGACIYSKMITASPSESLGAAATKADDFYNRWTFALVCADFDVQAAHYAGLGHVDRKMNANYRHYYRISVLGPEGNIVHQNATLVQPNSNHEIFPVIDEFEEKEKLVELKWNRDAHQRHFTAYHIERSVDQLNWERLNREPFIHATSLEAAETPFIIYSDSVKNYHKYYYRIVGLTPFGTISPISNVVEAMGRDKTGPAAAEEVVAKFIENQGVQINWQVESKIDVDKVFVGHSLYFTGPFTPIAEFDLADNPNSYLHKEADRIKINYYMVGTIDTAGNFTNSLIANAMVPDLVPPEPPKGLRGEVSDSGIVTIYWDSNQENDLYGYQVYFGGAPNSNYTQITTGPMSDTFFVDTVPIRQLTESVYYKIVAVDLRFNYSPFSDHVKLERPDVIPPSPPVFISYKVLDDTQIQMEWALSSSLDVAEHILYRQESGGEWQHVLEFQDQRLQYTDSDLRPSTKYIYKLIAKDDKGLISENPKILRAWTRVKEIDPPVVTLTKSKEGNLLEWEAMEEGSKMVIQRSTSGGPFITFEIINRSQSFFLDKKIRNQVKYNYRLQKISGALRSDFSPVF